MIRVRFQAPVANYTGRVGGVQFIDGLGETDDPNVVAYFARQGYTPIHEPQEGESAGKARKSITGDQG